MATAAQVIKAALQRILVQGSDAPLEADEYQDAVFALNNMMLAWDAEGIALGFTEITDLGDEVTVPNGALRGVIANLAVEVAPDYNGVISQGLAIAADEGLKVCRLVGQSITASAYPETLPIGSGNEDASLRARNWHFYEDSEAEILGETSGTVGLESGTEDAA